MKTKHSITVMGVIASTLLIGCDGDLDLASATGNTPQNQNPQTNAMNMRIPRSLQSSDDSQAPQGEANDSSTDTPAASKQTVDDVESIANSLDSAVVGAPSQALYLGAELLEERVEFAQLALSDIDSVWDQITSYCASVAEGAECDIPAGTLTLAFDDNEEPETLESALVYQSKPDDTYAHSVTFKVDADYSESEQIRWNDDRSLIAMSFESSWSDEEGTGTQSSVMQYTARDDGDRISLRDEYSMGQEKFTDMQQLHELNDGLNGVEIKNEFNWSDGYTSGNWQSLAVANDEGGKLVTTASFDDEDVILHARESFDAEGDLISSEYCEQTHGIDCSDPANWTAEEIDNDAQWYDIDLEAAGEDLEDAYESVCTLMELDEEECGFSETQMSVLDGAADIFDNTDDVTVYLCVETGEDEMTCRTDDGEHSELEQAGDFDTIDSVEFAAAIEAGGFSGEVMEATCEDCEGESVSDEAFQALLENAEIEEMIDALDVTEFDLGELDSLESIEELESFFMECDLDGADGCTADPSGLVEVDESDIEALDESEFCFAVNGDEDDDVTQAALAVDADAGHCVSVAELEEVE